MEGFGDFIKTVIRVLIIIFGLASFITAGIYYERNKKLEKGIYECNVELRIIKNQVK